MDVKFTPRLLSFGLILLGLLALAACGSPAPTAAPVETQAPALPTATAAPAATNTAAPAPTEEAAPTAEPAPTEAAPAAPDSPFPLPDDVQNFLLLDENSVNFQTGLTLEEAMDFYRQELGALGLTEREILTVFEGSTFSMVFDGGPDGLSVVVQGVDLGGGSSNINIRYEAV